MKSPRRFLPAGLACAAALSVCTPVLVRPRVAAATPAPVGFATPGSIHAAVEAGDLAKVKALLKANPKLIEQHQSYLGTPLAVAASEGKLEIVQYLIAQHAYVNARCADEYDSQTVLMAACTGNPMPDAKRMAIVRALVKAGALVRVVDRSGYTALHTAAYYGHAEVSNLLLEQGADRLALDQDGRTPFTEALRGAVMWDDWALMRFARVAIAEGADVNAHTMSGETMIDLAAHAGAVHTLDYLLRNGAIINAPDHEGRTALQVAQQENQAGAVAVLKQYGAIDGGPVATAVAATTPVTQTATAAAARSPLPANGGSGLPSSSGSDTATPTTETPPAP